jgi:integrase
LFDWMVDQGMLVTSPLRLRPRRETARRIPYLFDLPHACRLIEVAAALPDNNRATHRGATYATIFALLYGLGLRVGEVARLTLADIDLSRRLLVIRGTKPQRPYAQQRADDRSASFAGPEYARGACHRSDGRQAGKRRCQTICERGDENDSQADGGDDLAKESLF